MSEISIDTVLSHLKQFSNKLISSNTSTNSTKVALHTRERPRCSNTRHHPNMSQKEIDCWKLHPEKQPLRKNFPSAEGNSALLSSWIGMIHQETHPTKSKEMAPSLLKKNNVHLKQEDLGFVYTGKDNTALEVKGSGKVIIPLWIKVTTVPVPLNKIQRARRGILWIVKQSEKRQVDEQENKAENERRRSSSFLLPDQLVRPSNLSKLHSPSTNPPLLAIDLNQARNGKGRMGKGVLGVGFWWILQDFEEEGVKMEGNGWHYWKEGKKLGGGAHQGRSGWSKTTGVTDFFKEAPDLEVLSTEVCGGAAEVYGGLGGGAGGSTEVYGAYTEVYGVCRRFYGALAEAGEGLSRRHVGGSKELLRSLKRRKEEVKEASRTRVWGSFWSFKKGKEVSRGYQGVRKWWRICFCFCIQEGMSGLGGTEAGPAGPSGRETISRKVVKIPKEEELMFDGKGFHQFLDLFEMAAENEGAEDYDKVKQVIFFCKGRDLKEEVMEMEGWRELDWGKLVKEMKASPKKKGGVSSKGDYEEFSYFFDTRLKYLEKEGTFRNEDEACPLLWRALSKELQEMAKVRLIKGKKMVENRSGGYSLPTLKELKLAVDAEMKFKGEVSVEGSVYYRPFQGENEIMREELCYNLNSDYTYSLHHL
ncbi:hypothetical protein PPACK8108_LOCUS4003 [Phakopsora pachyrhizi]|uniref:Uncharacterized protein n=1 Tax=Phakopsora pachyrhizi TaxID=170000 RepID=A0AAV0APY6_PHAPC|nr:hypothetical protein PPACK8108_LOCUS4003 [Phakopsora pachyrhizi]